VTMVNGVGITPTSSFCSGRWQVRVPVHPTHRRTIMEVALYARVSTARQQQTQTIEQQMERLQTHVAKQPNWHLSEAHIYRDDGYSGAHLNRPGLDRLRDHAAFGEFELVLLTAPDRLARKYVHQVLIMEELHAVGCQVEFLERPMNDDPNDQLLLQIRGAVAEYERTLIADRMRRGRQAKLRSGCLLPWTRAPFGYILDAEHPRDPSQLRIDPAKRAVVEQIFAWYIQPEERLSLYAVAKQLSEDHIVTPSGGRRWNVATVRGILCNPVYTGTAYSGRTHWVSAQRRKSALLPVGPGDSHRHTPPEEWIPIAVPAMIPQETFDLAQARLKQNQQMARRNNDTYDYLLRGLISCAQCHLACRGVTIHPGYQYYVCRGHTDALRAAKGERCTARYTPATALDELVWQDLCRILRDPTLITHELERAQAGEWLPQALQARRRTLQQALAQLARQQERLLEVYLAEIIGRDEFERKHQELVQSHHGLAQQLRQVEAQGQRQTEVAQLASHSETFCQSLQPALEQMDFAQRRQLVELLIDRVIVDDGKVEIRYVIPTSRKGEEHPFYDLRLDHFHGLA
jgi:site-specific DNA recombinase